VKVRGLGAQMMNIIPVIPIGLFKEVKKGPIVVTIGRRAAAASVTSSLSIKALPNNQFNSTADIAE